MLVLGITGLLAIPLALGAFELIAFDWLDDVLAPGAAAAELPAGAEPTLGPGIFWHGGSHGSARII